MFLQLRMFLVLLVGFAATLAAGKVNAVTLYQEDFEGTGGGAGWTNGDVLETVVAGPITWQKTTGQDSIEVTNTHGTLDGLAIDGSTQSQAANGYGKYIVPLAGTTGNVAQTLTVDLFTTNNSFFNIFGYHPGLGFQAMATGWEFISPGNPVVAMGGVASLNTRVKGLISVSGHDPGNLTQTVYAEMRLASDNSLLGSAFFDNSDIDVNFLFYAQHSGDSRADRQGFDIDNILIVDGFITGGDGDFDSNGDVDGADFLLWQRGGSPSPLSPADLADWEANYATTLAVSSATAVPEPSSTILLGIALGAVALRCPCQCCIRNLQYPIPYLWEDSYDWSLSGTIGASLRTG